MEEKTKCDKEESEVTPDVILEQMGGCGRYQIRLAVVVHLIKTIVCFSTNSFVVLSATPKWFCTSGDTYENITSCFRSNNNSAVYCEEAEKNCKVDNNTQCSAYEFDPNFKTFTGEFNLVCGDDFLPSTISSIHIIGTLVGNLAGGQLADLYGRKRPFYMSVVILMLFHLLGFFAPSWKVLAGASFFTGVGVGFYLTIQYTILSEYSLSNHRVWMVGFPSWPLQTSLLALCTYLVRDWRYLQLLFVLMCIPALMTWFFVPESFRWYIGHDKPTEAAEIVEKVAKFNGREMNDINFEQITKGQRHSDTRKYTIMDLFKTRSMVKITLLLTLSWIALDVASYGVGFGIQNLSGNIFLNLFLFSIVGIPSKFIALYLQNRFGRRFSTLLCFGIMSVAGIAIGVIQTFEPAYKDELINAIAFILNAGIAAAWGPLQTMTLELYPTVIRNIGFGTLSVVGKISGVVGPQLVYVDTHIHGVLFYTCGGLAVIATLATLFLPETKGLNLQDKIDQSLNNDKNNAEGVDNKTFDTEVEITN